MGKISLEGKTALITGSAVRVGRETALACARAGMQVVIHYNRSREKAEELCSLIAQEGSRSWTLQADFTQADQFDAFIGQVIETAGPLFLLVNNASSFPESALDSMTLDNLVQQIEVNAWAPFALGRAFSRRITDGCIINLLDQRIASFDWKHVSYILSKQLFAAMSRMMAVAFAPGIRVNGIAPGLILPPENEPVSYIERLANTVPLKRHGDPADIAESVLFLASSSYITGETIFVDGGRHLIEYQR